MSYSLNELAMQAKAGRIDIIERAHGEAWSKAKNLLDKAEADRRNLNSVEHAEWSELSSRLNSIKSLRDIAQRNHDKIAAATAPYSESGDSRGSHEWREAVAGRNSTFDIDLGGAYRAKMAKSGNTYEKRDLTTTVGTVPTEVLNELILRLTQNSGVLAAAPRTINSDHGAPIKVPTLNAFSTAALVAEGSAIGESDPTIAAVTMNAYKVAVMLQVSSELVTDTAFDIERYLGEQLGIAIGTQISALLGGTNVGTTQPQGIMGTATSTGVTGGTGIAGAPTLANLNALWYSVPSQYRGAGMGWIMHNTTAQFIAGLLDTTGRPLLLPSVSESIPGTLFGAPVYVDNAVAAYGTGVSSIWCGNMQRFYGVRFAGALRVDASRDYAFHEDKITYRAIQRLDGRILNSDAGRLFVGGAS
jgi:HK97 family phage major capsid protein